jgi:hypothetical protein
VVALVFADVDPGIDKGDIERAIVRFCAKWTTRRRGSDSGSIGEQA